MSKIADFEEPRWWEEVSEWIGFVPLRPISYSGVWFDALSHIPRKPTKLNDNKYVLYRPVCHRWTEAERLLTEVINILAKNYLLQFRHPFNPSAWQFNQPHPTPEQARVNIETSQDWFVMLLGLLYWMTRKIPESSKFIEGLVPPSWLIKVIVIHSMHAAIESIRLTPLLHRKWDIARVGLWLHHPQDKPSQAPAAWFMEQGVPIWYRWSSWEASCSRHTSSFTLIAPQPEELQAMSTWVGRYIPPGAQAESTFTSAPSTSSFPSLSSPEHSTSFEPYLPEPSSALPAPSVQTPAIRPSAKSFWVTHFEKRQALHEKMRNKETVKDKQRRLAWTQNPSIKKASVYVWEWNDKGEFV
jgi:hypothetical protein